MEFVVGASEATMKSLLGKLGGLLAQEYSVIRGFRGDVQYINDELATMQAFLGDIGSAPEGHDLRLKDWMKQIRDMGYDMEDCIDDFAHRLPHDSLSDVKCSFIVTRIHVLWTFWPRRQIASRIGELKVRAQHIAERRSRYGVDNPKQSEGSNTKRISSRPGGIAEHLPTTRQLIHTEEPVGIDMQKLGDWLKKDTDSRKHRSVLSIVGFGGVGKTTIASALYREFRNKFECQASVTVSQNYDEDQVLSDIIGQIKPQDSKGKQQTTAVENRDLTANIAALVKQLVMPLIRGQKQQEQGSSGGTQTKTEGTTRDKLIKEIQGYLDGKRTNGSAEDAHIVNSSKYLLLKSAHNNSLSKGSSEMVAKDASGSHFQGSQ
ncbi:hypothetical protein ACQ4PT_027527 [Festuca glaucescens]